MKFQLTLNGKKVILDAEPGEKLLDILRREKLYSVKCGCEKGHCGNCTILLDNKPVPSCIVTIGSVREREIVTLEYFKSNPLYNNIIQGFNTAGIHMCGWCNAGKIFAAYSVLSRYHRPDRSAIYSAIQGLDACCADSESLANGILYAVAQRHTRENKSNGKKQ